MTRLLAEVGILVVLVVVLAAVENVAAVGLVAVELHITNIMNEVSR